MTTETRQPMMVRGVALLVGAVIVLGAGVGAVAAAQSDSRPKSPLPGDWVDDNGRVVRSRVPERIRYGTSIAASGEAWISNEAVIGDPTPNDASRAWPLFESEAGHTVIGMLLPDGTAMAIDDYVARNPHGSETQSKAAPSTTARPRD